MLLKENLANGSLASRGGARRGEERGSKLRGGSKNLDLQMSKEAFKLFLTKYIIKKDKSTTARVK